MKLIPLSTRSKKSKNYGKYFAQVDDEDYDWLIKWKWYAAIQKRRDIVYAQTNMLENGKYKSVLMHRFIMGVCDRKLDVDHKNHNGLINTRDNLRIGTKQQNRWNSRSNKGSSSKYKGVHFNKNLGKWTVQFFWQGKHIRGGNFINEEDAAREYDCKIVELYGEFAYKNFRDS